ncbi:DUF2946 family protein [Nitratireductor sp. ZSWI3]|uniref:DUF2946 family protein n=1 Tax=Nitratireductor sp. ZSWI3 TaxID=2966359 RepID=UPI00214FF6BF|nr:hypothetical protein [Nitratireductor sp. ZSWI3]MCR4265613.1 hypothetical protein [Nitratireductor sp. ZSWI3]
MGKQGAQTTWFDSLRRDAKLFAVAGFLALLLNALQPLMAAATASPADGFVICTTYGVGQVGDNNREHPRDVECPLCLTGHSCGIQLVANAPAAPAALTRPMAVGIRIALPWRLDVSTARAGASPPSIRAPPLSA